jgi:hypothetical protein
MPALDTNQALRFLDMLDPGGRHIIASEAPFGKDGRPLWERGRTFEAHERRRLIGDIEKRQDRGSNVYYGVNRPRSASDQYGSYGKCTVDDIIVIRAMAFDIDFFQDADAINTKLTGELRPSKIISTGGGLHLIYLLDKVINVNLYRPAINAEQKQVNAVLVKARTFISQLAHDFEALLSSLFPQLKIDNMSNVDRVMRLPGTVNYPKAEKRAKGQVEALAHIVIDNQIKCDPRQLRAHVPRLASAVPRQKFQVKNSAWPPYKMALYCCEFIRDNGLADSNEIYTLWVMLPLIGMIHDENGLSIEEAEECFLEAVSGGERYGSMGRGQDYFKRQWRSHRPELARQGTKSIGSLIKFCRDHGMMTLPWSGAVKWQTEFERQEKVLQEVRTQLTENDVIELRSILNVGRRQPWP